MLVLGICGGHDANWCIFYNGKMLGAFEKERFSKIRHDTGYVLDLAEKTLNSFGFSFDDVNLVVTSEYNHKGTEPGLNFVSSKRYEKPNDWIENATIIKNRKIPVFSIPHHLCHAAYSYYLSGKNESAVLTLDGGGDLFTIDAYTSSSVSYWKDGKLSWLERIDNSDIGSLWHIYSKVIFGNIHAAGKLMGLSAWGENALVDDVRKYFVRPTRGLLNNVWSVKNCWPDEDFPPFCNVNDWTMKEAKDLAFAIQKITTEAGVQLSKKIKSVTKTNFLALSGGVALNGYMNTSILNQGIYEDVFVPPSVHDGGLSIGAVLFVLNHILGIKTERHSENDIVFTGMNYNNDICIQDLKKHHVSYKIIDKNKKITQVANELKQGKIIAYYESKSEHGPRALGHRSILASPVDPNMCKRLNSTIKFREPFRPIAPVVLESDVSYCTNDIKRSPFMMYIVNTTETFQNSCPSGVHVDGSARLQTVNKDNPMGLILDELKNLDHPPALLNTSFNVCTPIVETPEDAIQTFLKVPIDSLYLEDLYISKSELN